MPDLPDFEQSEEKAKDERATRLAWMDQRYAELDDKERRLHPHHLELREAHRAAREESVERHRLNEASEQQQKISSALSRLANFTAEHDLLIVAYLAERDHKQRMRSLERATEARRGQVLALGRLLAMPREALLEHAGFVACARRLKTPQRKRAAKPGRVIERSHDE